MSNFTSVMNALFLAGAALYIAKNINLLDQLNWALNSKDPNPHVSAEAMASSLQTSSLPSEMPNLQNSIKNAYSQVQLMNLEDI
jgi:hypothetical protein